MSVAPVAEITPPPQIGYPPVPRAAQETGLPFSFLCDLLLKVLYFNGSMLGRDLAAHACLPWSMVADVLKFLSNEGHCGTTGVRGPLGPNEGFAEGLQYLISAAGRERAREVLELSQYAGPAPIALDVYVAVVRHQGQYAPAVTRPQLRDALSHLVL
ncbi:MAG TPA: ATP-binding protein, partial [Candidatus Dormibacteraeota bacterium]|nr:ATP-binding protein [Candidatus Dormibacteraeota bacterium]